MLSAIKISNVKVLPFVKCFSASAFLSNAQMSIPDKCNYHNREQSCVDSPLKYETARPDVHYHAADDKQAGKQRYPVSFLSHKELPEGRSIENYSRAIIGWSTSERQINPSTFAENEEFAELLHKVIGEKIHTIDDPSLKGMAEWQQEG
jgi:hypothetical protein